MALRYTSITAGTRKDKSDLQMMVWRRANSTRRKSYLNALMRLMHMSKWWLSARIIQDEITVEYEDRVRWGAVRGKLC
jgi:hypothetical protein